jgi:hypothetical protein
MYYGSKELRELWESPQRVIVVVQPLYLDEARRVLGTPEAQCLHVEDYYILVNHKASQS